jgi:ribosomal protein S6
VKRYEGLFILDTSGSAESAAKVTEAVRKLIGKAGGKVEAEQKLDRRQFARVANKKHTGGFYVNLVFELEPTAMDGLETAFDEHEEVFRTQITLAPATTEAVAD